MVVVLKNQILGFDVGQNKLYILQRQNCFKKKNWGEKSITGTHTTFLFVFLKTLRGLCQTSVEGQPTT